MLTTAVPSFRRFEPAMLTTAVPSFRRFEPAVLSSAHHCRRAAPLFRATTHLPSRPNLTSLRPPPGAQAMHYVRLVLLATTFVPPLSYQMI